MAFYYVRDDGTCVNDDGREAVTKRTGTFAAMGVANFYNDIQSAINDSTTAPVDGDYILVSSTHDTGAQTPAPLWSTVGVTKIAYILCVDDANAENESTGAKETAASSFSINESFKIQGIDLQLNSLWISSAILKGFVTVKKSTITSSATQTPVRSSGTSIWQSDEVTIDVTANLALAAYVFGSPNRTGYIINGGSTNGTTFFLECEANRPGNAIITGTDLSTITGHLVDYQPSAITGYSLDLLFKSCKLNASLTDFINNDFSTPFQKLKVVNCSAVSADAEWQYYLKTWTGVVEAIDTIYRDQSTAYEDSGAQASLEVITNATCDSSNLFEIDFEARFSSLESPSTDTVRIYFTSDTVLTDSEVFAEITYPDATSNEIYNTLSNAPQLSGTYINSPLAAGTTHTTDGVSTWTAGKANVYFMDIDTSGDPGRNSAAKIRIYIGIASATIYFDTEFDMV